MTEREAIGDMVEQWDAIPHDWVQEIMEAKGEYHTLPMWGWLWIVEDFIGEKLEALSKPETEDEEMEGELNIAGTAAYLYNIDGYYLIGVNGAGWNFYDGVWDKIYDLLGLQWHDEPSQIHA